MHLFVFSFHFRSACATSDGKNKREGEQIMAPSQTANGFRGKRGGRGGEGELLAPLVHAPISKTATAGGKKHKAKHGRACPKRQAR